jgi:hypothetical protein
MARSQRQSDSSVSAARSATLAQSLAPEDIAPGDYVSVLHEVFEYPSWYWCDESFAASREQVVRIAYTPRDEATPLKVRAVCLPFVLVQQPCGRTRTLDVRTSRLARLDRAYAAAARNALKKQSKRRRCRDGGTNPTT